jgi:predicted GNAT family acetyltransferase
MVMTANEMTITNNTGLERFELHLDGHMAVLEYQQYPDKIVFTHTEVPPQWSGRGHGSELVKSALDYARDEGLRVVPRCSFVANYIKEHPEYQDLVKKKL